jgi:phage tail tube protein FII
VIDIPVDIWLRGTDFAKTDHIEGIVPAPDAWTDEDVRQVLAGMLRAMDRQNRPGEADRDISLRGLSWIVNPFEGGGVVIAIEITMGAAIAGPLDIDQSTLEHMIRRVLARPAGAAGTDDANPRSVVH